MALQQFTNLNYEDIKTSIKDYLRENSNFTDFDFEGSNLSVLINTLAYNTYITAYNTNMVVNESFIDSATLRENVVSLARNIGYVPRSKRAAKATVSFQLAGISSSTKTIEIQPGLISNSDVQDTTFLFSIPDKITLPVLEGESFGEFDIFQGQYLENAWTVNNSLESERYVLPNDSIDTSTLRVTVQESGTSTVEEQYTMVDNIVGVTSTSNIFLIQETSDERYELLFGDGVFGKKLPNGAIVRASYIKTQGRAANGAVGFRFVGQIRDDNGAKLNNIDPLLDTVSQAENGDDIESLQSVKYYAPRLYSSQHRAVTATDYEAIIPSIYPNIHSVSAYGGEELDPPQYGRVFIAAKPRNGSYLSDYTKKQLLKSLRSYTVAGIVPMFIDLKFLYVEIDSYVYYNTNFIGDPDSLKASIYNNLTQYAVESEVNQFGGRFKYSKIQTLIDNVNSSITSNITMVRMRRNLVAKVNQFAQYELCFGNEFYCGNDTYNIKSTGFTVSTFSGTCYFSDSKIKGTSKGNLFLFRKKTDDEIEILSTKFGTIDYQKGEVLIDTVNITSTVKSNNIIEVQAVPLSNDVLARQELYLQLDASNSNIYMRQDVISSGRNTSGTRFDVQSSYQNGSKTR
jgi:hypothetical protein|tara:strand:+ start:9622 stop:11502 length:1881 start_codon:yes stop_codon:yes gene_type:complete